MLVLLSNILSAQKIEVSSFGYDPNNATECLLRAFSSRYDTIVITKQTTDWKVAPLSLKNISNKTIIFEDGVVISALPGKFNDIHAPLIELLNSNNIELLGNGATLKMNKREYVEGGWRHALSLRQCKNVTIKGFEIRESGGDGIYIAGRAKGTFCENIYIEDVKSINNKRQGMSIISAQNVFVKNSEFTETKGILPEAGVDIEPNNSSNRIVNVNFEHCSFNNNNHSGLLLALEKLDANSIPISISLKECYLSNNHVETNRYAAAEINIYANKESPVKGNVFFDQCMVKNSNWGILYSRKRSDAFNVIFRNCAAINICKNKKFSPISFEVPDYKTISSSLGGFTFDNLYLEYSSTSPVVKIRGSRLGTLTSFKDVKGHITVKNHFLIPSDQIKYINYDSQLNKDVNLNITHIITN
ncbi:right-handed parallel beta-helix repeat-containing protein [Flavobacteriaceae bacterium F89]|uniref:Right-handed parallel beta-helix repeat-containing protein n=1 Tax=Cerina litoralis TaxID=2874477 RepID=A0AAE3EX36_9FLAO|nr:right-handed parallel beta-helix repeat-containing protein [Cerina litoralis]MCG2461898.1 right-handed parallel beta-helix repeat-containing protein [Cerina litoralis]